MAVLIYAKEVHILGAAYAKNVGWGARRSHRYANRSIMDRAESMLEA